MKRAPSLRQLAITTAMILVFPFCIASARAQADLSVSKAVIPNSLHPGDSGDYQITVQNLGPGIASGIIVSDSVPAGLFVTGTVPTATGSSTLSWNLPDMDAGSSATVTVHFL